MTLARIHAAIAITSIAILAQTSSAQSADERAIRAVGEEWQRALAARDIDKVVALHTPDAIYMLSHAPLISGSAAIRAGWSEALKLPNYKVQWTPTKIDVASPTVATEYGTYTESYTGPDGNVVNDGGNYITIWHKINGQWRVAVDNPNTTSALPSTPMDMTAMQLAPNTAVQWTPRNIPGFDPGTQIAVIHGDPSKAGDYTLRLKFPDGYRFPVHWHPNGEHVTVLSGTFLLATGANADWSLVKPYGPGDFIYAPPRMPHYGGARGETIIQLHGTGPFTINLGAPK